MPVWAHFRREGQMQGRFPHYLAISCTAATAASTSRAVL